MLLISFCICCWLLQYEAIEVLDCPLLQTWPFFQQINTKLIDLLILSIAFRRLFKLTHWTAVCFCCNGLLFSNGSEMAVLVFTNMMSEGEGTCAQKQHHGQSHFNVTVRILFISCLYYIRHFSRHPR